MLSRRLSDPATVAAAFSSVSHWCKCEHDTCCFTECMSDKGEMWSSTVVYILETDLVTDRKDTKRDQRMAALSRFTSSREIEYLSNRMHHFERLGSLIHYNQLFQVFILTFMCFSPITVSHPRHVCATRPAAAALVPQEGGGEGWGWVSQSCQQADYWRLLSPVWQFASVRSWSNRGGHNRTEAAESFSFNAELLLRHREVLVNGCCYLRFVFSMLWKFVLP